jgi:tRNA pseudouridine13 synthase
LIQAADDERNVGIECYATRGPPCPARAKASAEDFTVEELMAKQVLTTEDLKGYFPLYRVQKRSIDTMHMAQELAVALRSNVSYGGLKDKRAVAIQYVTPTSRRSIRPPEVVREHFTASLIGYVPRPISRGAVEGNKFVVTLRDCCAEIESRIGEAMELAEERRLPNFYGLQRFGTSGAGTHLIGGALVRGEFERAVNLMLLSDDPSNPEEGLEAKDALAAGRYAEGINLLPPGRDVEKRVARVLSRHPGEWVKALRSTSLKLRRLYVQAYQSMIFNRTLSRAIETGVDISTFQEGDNWADVSEDGLVTSAARGVRDAPTMRAVPMVQLVGYAYRDYGSRFDALIKEVLEDEGVTPGQFYVKEMQEISSEGGFRRPHMAVRDSNWSVVGGTARLGFTLARGQYATVLLREIIKPMDPTGSGLG